MLAYMSDTSDPRNAYPAYWAHLRSLEKGLRDSIATHMLPCGNVQIGSCVTSNAGPNGAA